MEREFSPAGRIVPLNLIPCPCFRDATGASEKRKSRQGERGQRLRGEINDICPRFYCLSPLFSMGKKRPEIEE